MHQRGNLFYHGKCIPKSSIYHSNCPVHPCIQVMAMQLKTPAPPNHSRGAVWEVALHIHATPFRYFASQHHGLLPEVASRSGHSSHAVEVFTEPQQIRNTTSSPRQSSVCWGLHGTSCAHCLERSGGFALHLSLQGHKAGKINVIFSGQPSLPEEGTRV